MSMKARVFADSSLRFAKMARDRTGIGVPAREDMHRRTAFKVRQSIWHRDGSAPHSEHSCTNDRGWITQNQALAERRRRITAIS